MLTKGQPCFPFGGLLFISRVSAHQLKKYVCCNPVSVSGVFYADFHYLMLLDVDMILLYVYTAVVPELTCEENKKM
jgi:hypothetical protein